MQDLNVIRDPKMRLPLHAFPISRASDNHNQLPTPHRHSAQLASDVDIDDVLNWPNYTYLTLQALIEFLWEMVATTSNVLVHSFYFYRTHIIGQIELFLPVFTFRFCIRLHPRRFEFVLQTIWLPTYLYWAKNIVLAHLSYYSFHTHSFSSHF